MTEEDRRLSRLLRILSLTREVEIDCSTCLEWIATYVDRELQGNPVEQEMPAVHQHLAVCQDCREEYRALYDLTALDAAGELPSRASLLGQPDPTLDEGGEKQAPEDR
jgi:hypothetical protein